MYIHVMNVQQVWPALLGVKIPESPTTSSASNIRPIQDEISDGDAKQGAQASTGKVEDAHAGAQAVGAAGSHSQVSAATVAVTTGSRDARHGGFEKVSRHRDKEEQVHLRGVEMEESSGAQKGETVGANRHESGKKRRGGGGKRGKGGSRVLPVPAGGACGRSGEGGESERAGGGGGGDADDSGGGKGRCGGAVVGRAGAEDEAEGLGAQEAGGRDMISEKFQHDGLVDG